MNKMLRILSEPVRSGKTTLLWHWLQNKPNTFALLMPDIANKRYLYVSSINALLPLEVNAENYEEAALQRIGRFTFLASSFTLAQQELLKAFIETNHTLLIDEIGKLEYKQKKGFEPIISLLLNQWKVQPKQDITLVVRDYLLEEAIQTYQLSSATLIKAEYFSLVRPVAAKTSVNGLILCGGESKRMGSPKALLNYNGLPQYLWVHELLKKHCLTTYVACKKEQSHWFDPSLAQLHDNDKYPNSGPLGALLSYLENEDEKAVLIIGCDYPLLNPNSIALLKEACLYLDKSVALSATPSEPLEPLLSCIHPKDFKEIRAAFNNGERSLQRILIKLKTIKLVVETTHSIKSFDEPTNRLIIGKP